MKIRLWIYAFVFLLTFSLKAQNAYPGSKIRVEAIGKGQTTGHVADLVVRNKNKAVLQILPQRVFIPSGGAYQPYIADIPAASIKPDSTLTLRLMGYCTDEHLRPTPSELELVSIDKWIPIRSLDTTAKEGVLLVSKNAVIPFIKDHISYIITSLAYRPLYPAPDTLQIALWPGTDIPVGGTLSHYARPDLYATVISKALSLLESGVDSIQATKDFSTPFSVDVKKERETLIQQLLWIYATTLAGKKYEKDTFAAKIYDQFKTRSGLAMIPALEKLELDEGVDEFWNLFLRTAKHTKLFDVKKPLTVHGTLVDLPIDTIEYPWSVISLTDIIMKPAYEKIVPVKGSSPVVPILAGSTSFGTLLYIAFHKQEADSICTINATLQPFPASCQQANGSIVLTIDIDSLYSYTWSNGSSGRDLFSVPAGQYSVTVTRKGTTCTQTFQAEITNTDPVITTEVTTQDAHCGGSDGSATPSVNPPGFYTYTWSNGAVDQVLDSVAAGFYTLIVHAGGSCSDTTEVFINDIPISYSVSLTTNPEKCGRADGRIEAAVTPEGAYQFLWSNGDTTNAINGLIAGNYFVTVSQTGTICQIIMEAVVESISGPVINNIVVTDATCGNQDGSIMTEVNPPGEYEYNWSNGDSTSFIQNLGAGVYTLIVSLPGTECRDTASINVNELGSPVNLTTTVLQHAYCGLSNGSAIAEPDVAGEYTYQWPNGQTTQQVNNLAAGNHIVSVTISGTQCVLTQSVTIDSVAPNFIDVFSILNATCITNGEVVFQINPSDTSQMTIEIIHPGGFTALNLGAGIFNLSSFVSVTPGGYLLSVYDPDVGNQCIERDSITIELSNPSILLQDDAFFTLIDQPVSGNVLANDSGLNLLLVGIDSVQGGAVSFSPDGNFTFTPDAGFSGTGSFYYSVMDGCGDTAYAYVFITVQTLTPPGNPTPKFSLNISLTNLTLEPGEEHASIGPPNEWRIGYGAMLEYDVESIHQSSRLFFSPGNTHFQEKADYVHFEQLGELVKWDNKSMSVSLNGGLGLLSTLNDIMDPLLFYSMNVESEIQVGKKIDIHAAIHIKGWQKIQGPGFSIGISYPFIQMSTSNE